MKKIPVILDTDIGGDIDDTWALAMMLNSPELDVKLITTATGDTLYRAKLTARLLEVAGRTDIPIGVGIPLGFSGLKEPQEKWLKGFNLKNYKGRIIEDGVSALIKTIMSSKEKVTVIGIAPLPNIARALSVKPEIMKKARFVGMHGCIDTHHDGKKGVYPEWNVCSYIRDAREVLSAKWEKVITPLDTCGAIRLTGERYQACLRSKNPLMRAVMENYKHWLTGWGREQGLYSSHSSILFDTVAIYLAYDQSFCKMKKAGLIVKTDGCTYIKKGAPEANIAIAWKDKEAFLDHLVERLI